MSLRSSFLTLSMKEQICLTIIVLNLFCLLVILSICGSLSYEFLKEDYYQKKIYFFNKYKEYIDSCFYFQNFCLLQYEEIIKRVQKQSFEFYKIFEFYPITNLNNYTNKVIFYDDSSHKNIIDNQNIFTNDPELYFLCFWEDNNLFHGIPLHTSEFCPGMQIFLVKNYQPMANSMFFHDIKNFFNHPWYNVSLLNSPIIINVNLSSILSFNANTIHQKLIEIQGESTVYNYKKLKKYFNDKMNFIISRLNDNNLYIYFSQESDFFQQMFYKINSEIKNNLNGTFLNNIDILYEYLSKIHYENNTFSLINHGADKNFFYSEANIIDNFLYYLMSKLTNILDIYFIPLSSVNNNSLSLELCILFMLAQANFQIDNLEFDELINNLKISNLTFENCFIYKEVINNQLDIKDIFNLNLSSFLTINNLIYQGILYLNTDKDDSLFYFMKYSYPNYNILKEFRTEYLMLDQLNLYLFISFKEPIKITNYFFQISQNIFFFILIIIIYIWLICLFINLLILYKVIKNWTDPIIKLQEAVESSSIKDESIFKYQYDDIINELFGTSKELLMGQNDNNEKGLKNFNILSIPKDKQKKIDTNIYKKNLIINNNIMNKLINEQKNMMDFSNNIKLNEANDKKQIIKNKKKSKKKIIEENNSEENLISSKDTKNKSLNKDKNKNIKNSEEIENEPYKKLFQISEYLYRYSDKIESNNIFIIDNNSIINESKMSKNVSKNNKNTSNFKGSFIKNDLGINKENNEKVYINMLDEDNMSYLWYMEAKKRNNKNFNYTINDDYNELFMDFINN